MTKLNFATPLPQSSHSEVLEWKFPGKYKQYVLTGKSRAAWHTSFVVPQLNLLLDAGLCVNQQRPKHIFLTHGHSDHTLLTPAFIDSRDDPPDIYCPVEIAAPMETFLNAKTTLNKGGLMSEEELAPRLLNHHTHGLRHGDTVPLKRTVDFTAEAFVCDHTVPCLGYVFKLNSRKLKPEYTGLKGTDLKALRESGTEITTPFSAPVFAFLGDTQATTLAAEPQWLRDGIPVVITECSFLYEEHTDQAIKTKHTIWADLEPVVRKWPKTTFVLTHFSLRYQDGDIRRFFAEMHEPPSNIVIWVDGEPEADS